MSEHRGFEITVQGAEQQARLGRLLTPHGVVETPAFMPCASQAVVRACSPEDVAEAGLRMMVCNTWHLHLRPGGDVVAALGGLHRFMGWDGALATDSGGYQAFSLARPADVSEEGVWLASPVDGTRQFLTPETSVATQEKLGADIAVALDICTPYPVSAEDAREALRKTLRWGERCLRAHGREDQGLWGVAQGSVYDDLRAESAAGMAGLGFTGFGIGGLSVGETREEMMAALDASVTNLPPEAPKWVMGVGTPRDIVAAALRGTDLFDCVLPTRMARHGSVLTGDGPLKIGNATHREDEAPLEEGCDCATCRRHSRAYLHHLFRIGEAAAWRLLTLHNLRWYARLMERLREAIAEGSAEKLLGELPVWTQRDGEA
jgi:queuine tRNA-ribosyltransferase